MKKRLFSILILLLCCLLVILATSCSGGIDTDKADADIDTFLAAIGEGDYDTAEALLHPHRPADLQAFVARIETEERVDFGAGIEIVSRDGYSYSYYDSDVDGSRYELDLEILIGGVAADMEIEIVQNDDGYGIYDLEIDVED